MAIDLGSAMSEFQETVIDSNPKVYERSSMLRTNTNAALSALSLPSFYVVGHADLSAYPASCQALLGEFTSLFHVK